MPTLWNILKTDTERAYLVSLLSKADRSRWRPPEDNFKPISVSLCLENIDEVADIMEQGPEGVHRP